MVMKMYPKISDAENSLRIEKYLSSIRKIIRLIKTVKYEIPTPLELNEDAFQYKRVIAQTSDISSLEQNYIFELFYHYLISIFVSLQNFITF